MTPRQQINAAGLAIIKSSEVFYALPYLCPAGIWTNGYGHTTGVTKDTPRISVAQAEDYLRGDVATAEAAIARLVNVPLTSNQYSALVSLVFNIGSGRFQSSTLRMRLNRGEYAGAAAQFKVWRMARGRVLRGLEIRRARETALFNTADRRTTTSETAAQSALVIAIKDAQAKIMAVK